MESQKKEGLKLCHKVIGALSSRAYDTLKEAEYVQCMSAVAFLEQELMEIQKAEKGCGKVEIIGHGMSATCGGRDWGRIHHCQKCATKITGEHQ